MESVGVTGGSGLTIVGFGDRGLFEVNLDAVDDSDNMTG